MEVRLSRWRPPAIFPRITGNRGPPVASLGPHFPDTNRSYGPLDFAAFLLTPIDATIWRQNRVYLAAFRRVVALEIPHRYSRDLPDITDRRPTIYGPHFPAPNSG